MSFTTQLSIFKYHEHSNQNDAYFFHHLPIQRCTLNVLKLLLSYARSVCSIEKLLTRNLKHSIVSISPAQTPPPKYNKNACETITYYS